MTLAVLYNSTSLSSFHLTLWVLQSSVKEIKFKDPNFQSIAGKRFIRGFLDSLIFEFPNKKYQNIDSVLFIGAVPVNWKTFWKS